METTSNLYKRHRFPSEIIHYAVWLYYRFNLSNRDIEDLLSAEYYRLLRRRAFASWKVAAAI